MLTLWKSLALLKLDYCSQLWSPIEKGDIQSVEMIQRSFIQKIQGMYHLSYWEQLRRLGMYSHERRRERYAVIYIWRILEGQVPNICHSNNADGLVRAKWHDRRGRLCIIPPINHRSSAFFQRRREASLAVRGQRLFNILPPEIRNLLGCSVDYFKGKLDAFLRGIPDEPQIPGYTAQRLSDSNSLLDMTRLMVTRVDELDGPTTSGTATTGCGATIAWE